MNAILPRDQAVLASLATGPWTVPMLVTVCVGWRAGHTVSAIGAAVGKTKNAVVGKAHRLQGHGILDPRPSPIIRNGVPCVTAVPRVAGPTLPALASVAVTMAPVVQPPRTPPAHAVPPVVQARVTYRPMPFVHAAPRGAPPPRPVVTPEPRQSALPMTGVCRFPLWGDREGPTHVYCDAPAPLGESWCAPCREKVFLRVRARAA
ncbi:MAG TPA: GcrA family cell cycle regulator [Pseudolabrys sp.]